MKTLMTILLTTLSLVSCKASSVKHATIPFEVSGMVFDESASELLLRTPEGVMRFGADGKLIAGPRPGLEDRFEEVRVSQMKASAKKSPASITELAHTPFGVVSYDEAQRNLYLVSFGSYPRLIVSNIERPSDVVYSKVSGRLFFSIASDKSLVTLYLRPAI